MPAPMLKIATIGLALAFVADPSFAEIITEEYKVRSGGELIVVSDRGHIEVQTGRGSKVEIEVQITGDEPELMRVDTRQEGNTIHIRGKYKGNNHWRKMNVRYNITVPKKFNVNLRTGGGGIHVTDLEGEIDANTSGGGLQFGNIKGAVRGHTSGGSITLEGSEGPANLKTSGGSINVGDVMGNIDLNTSGGSINIGHVKGSVDAITSGGGIHIEEANGAIDARTSGGSITAYLSEQPKEDSQLKTSAGTVTVYLAKDLALDIKARTSMGTVKTDFPINGKTKSKRRLDGSINGGGPELYLSTSAGSVRIKEK